MTLQEIKYHLKIYYLTAKMQIKLDMQYRMDFFNNILRIILKVFAVIILVQIIYLNTNEIEGWTKAEFYLLTGTYSLTFPLYYALFSSISEISYKIKDGYLDGKLLKPVNILFQFFCGSQLTYVIPDIITNAAIIIYAYKMGANIPVLELLFCISVGVILYLAVSLFIQTLNFYTLFPNNAGNLADAFFDFGKVPANFYPVGVRLFFSFIFPVLATGGIAFLINMYNLPKYLYVNVTVVIFAFLYFSIKFWGFSIKKYSGASS